MFLEIVTPEKKIFQGEVKRVRLPGSNGLFEILKDHAPIVSTLGKGTIRVVDFSRQTLKFQIDGGIVENKNNKIIVLLDTI